MREDEGRNIEGDFYRRLDIIEQDVNRIEERAPQVVKEYETKLLARLKDRLQELQPETGVAIEPERVLQEVAIFADRVSITEEIVRLKSHIRQFRMFLQSGEPVGRKLDFLIQEFNREANTIASKANDFELAKTVVEIKAKLKKSANRSKISNEEELMGIKLINIGFGNFVSGNRVIAIISPESAPINGLFRKQGNRECSSTRRMAAVPVLSS
jgi:uncharacterized protein (TIGR00255 family)